MATTSFLGMLDRWRAPVLRFYKDFPEAQTDDPTLAYFQFLAHEGDITQAQADRIRRKYRHSQFCAESVFGRLRREFADKGQIRQSRQRSFFQQAEQTRERFER